MLLTLVMWISHRFSTFYMACTIPQYRQVISNQKTRFIVVPIIICGAVCGFFYAPQSIIRLSLTKRFILLACLDFFLSLYHFAMQHYGMLALYRARSNSQRLSQRDLRLERFACLFLGGLVTASIRVIYGELNLFDHLYPDWLGRSLTSDALMHFKLGLVVASTALAALLLARYGKGEHSVPKIMYLASLYVMSVVTMFIAPLCVFALHNIQHWLISLTLTSKMTYNSSQAAAPQGHWYGFWHKVHHNRIMSLGMLMLVCIAMLPVMEADAFILRQYNPDRLWFGDFLTRIMHTGWLHLFGAMAFCSAFLHYIYDRAIFRLSNKAIRKVSLPLLT